MGSPLTSISSNDEVDKPQDASKARSMSIDPAPEAPAADKLAPVIDDRATSPSNASVEAALKPAMQRMNPIRHSIALNSPGQQQFVSSATVNPSSLSLTISSIPPNEVGGKDSWRPDSLPDHFGATLPGLPAVLLRNRPLAGGLLRKKRERERDSRTSGLSGGMELFKTGVVQPTHCPSRNMVGQPLDPKARVVRAGKVVLTSDWNVAIQELKGLRAMEKVEQLKNENRWSFRQIKKQKAPPVIKSHRDYLLEEMVCRDCPVQMTGVQFQCRRNGCKPISSKNPAGRSLARSRCPVPFWLITLRLKKNGRGCVYKCGGQRSWRNSSRPK